MFDKVYAVVVVQKAPYTEFIDTIHDSEESAFIRADFIRPKYKHNTDIMIEQFNVYDIANNPNEEDAENEDNE